MKRLLALCLFLPLASAETDLSQQLRDALYTEEVTRDPASAADSYEKILADFDAQRPLAASAIFRLAEIRRAQERKDDAIPLYQRLLREFPERETEGKLARAQLAALGAEVPEAPGLPNSPSPELQELARLKQLVELNPEILKDPELISVAAGKGWDEVVQFLLEQGTDPNQSYALDSAVGSLQLETCKILLAHSKPTPGIASGALETALKKGGSGFLKALLDLGLAEQAADPAFRSPLHLAVDNSAVWAIEPLIRHGISADTFDSSFYKTKNQHIPITPLHLAALGARMEIARKLIELGAKVDLPSPDTDITPLVLAAATKNPEIIAFLLEKGADPKQPHALETLVAGDYYGIPATRLLLEAGCDPNKPGPSGIPPVALIFDWKFVSLTKDQMQTCRQNRTEFLKLFLAHGADPNTTSGTYPRRAASPDRRDSSSLTDRSPFLPIKRAVKALPESLLLKSVLLEERQGVRDVGLIRILLDGGAKPTTEFPEVFEVVARSEEVFTLDLAKALLRFRPDFLSTEWIAMGDWNPKVKKLFLDELLFPSLISGGGIHIVFDNGERPARVAEAGKEIRPTAVLLHNFIKPSSGTARENEAYAVTLVRRDPTGVFSRTEIDFSGTDPLPVLSEGDIIEFSAKKNDKSSPLAITLGDLRWDLLRRISFPISLTTDGKTQEITLRGGLLVYDPTKPEAPLLTGGKLVELLYKPRRASNFFKMTLQIRRKDWPSVDLTPGTPEWDNFPLDAGDQLNVALIKDPNDRPSLITTVPGTGYVAYYFDAHLPTLVEAIAELYAPWTVRREPETPLAQRLPELLKHGGQGENSIPTILPHPDFSSIVIHRGQGDDRKPVSINLAEAIANCTAQTTSEQARSSDVQLQRGDVVEFPLLSIKEPWTGFTPEQSRFFSKILSGKILVMDGDKAELLAYEWSPVNWTSSPAGLLPFAPEEGFADTRLFTLLDSRNSQVNRDGKDLGGVGGYFLIRDGDQVRRSDAIRLPRARIEPPPTSR